MTTQRSDPGVGTRGQCVVDAARLHWLPLLYLLSLVAVLVAIGNIYALYHQVDLRGFFSSGTPVPVWGFVGDKSTAMLVEAFMAASVGVTIRWIALSLDARSHFVLPGFLHGWLADFVQIPFIVTILVIFLRSPGLAFGDKFLSLRTADIDFLWAVAAIAGYFSVETKKLWLRLHRRVLRELPTASHDYDETLASEETTSSKDRSMRFEEVGSDEEAQIGLGYEKGVPGDPVVVSVDRSGGDRCGIGSEASR